jgi:hypothetical protein
VDALRISRLLFLAAVTSHDEARALADATVEDYLSPASMELT